ncbi:MAG: 5-methyltetrahydropteroyltriglutamate--homocysteine S-methyltransferase [Rhodospirillaceae bacterium]|jgi:5-methyltetrahydropteroyltriglutamate--homocysteine methyltransferase|nr:5-methyltetrahydropteroyltriglutamate--homocysteine S-methyltransferase [Rhodospirillaceae bacterium]MBT5457803.1 5-methyltetrahydropteroyltriglutamate--homocysteine S-methyltransferase [Rhodospirillaceae bacterium]
MMSIPALSKPPFRADHVGSLLRPEELLDARYAEGPEKPTVDDLRALEDRHIPNVISLQEKVGLQSVTDGEFRRASFRSPVVSRVDGFTTVPQDPIWAARDETGHSHPLGDAPLAIAKLARNRGIATHEFEFLRPRTDRTPKIALPAPSYHFFYRHPEKAAYSDPEDYLDDLVRIYREELAELGAMGATYVQFDEVIQAYMCDENIRAALTARGDDYKDLSALYVDLINRIIDGRPDDMTVAVHFCRGNSMGRWVAEGGYDAIAEIVFGGLKADALFMEYDTPRAGDFAPLRYVTDDKIVVLGLISTKTGSLEEKDDLKRRIDEAAKLVPLERLCLSPQCGFASRDKGNPITIDDQIAKLSLVVDVATDVWGGVLPSRS